MPIEIETRHLRIFGRVQGVGYRDALCAQAGRHAVTGWVRNRRDGTVEALIQGPPAALDALLAWAREGPPAAQVTHVEARASNDDPNLTYADFRRLPTE